MVLALNTRVVLESPYGHTGDGSGAIIRNGQLGYVRGQVTSDRLRVAFPGIRRDGSYQRATITVSIYEWWVRVATEPEIEYRNTL